MIVPGVLISKTFAKMVFFYKQKQWSSVVKEYDRLVGQVGQVPKKLHDSRTHRKSLAHFLGCQVGLLYAKAVHYGKLERDTIPTLAAATGLSSRQLKQRERLLANSGVGRGVEMGDSMDLQSWRSELPSMLASLPETEWPTFVEAVFLRFCGRGDVMEGYQFKAECAGRKLSPHTAWFGEGPDLEYARAAIFLRQFDIVRKFLKGLKPKSGSGKRSAENEKKELEWLTETLDINTPMPRNNSGRHKKKSSSFSKLVQGKSVALVAPGPKYEGCGQDIDAHDVVVRFNYDPNAVRLWDTALEGRKTHLSYYNGEVWKTKGFDDWMSRIAGDDEPPYLVFRSKSSLDYARKFASVRGEVIGPLPGVFGARFKMHGVQRAVWDILRCNPASVSVYGADFMTGWGNGDASLRQGWYRTAAADKLGIFRHDLRESFALSKAWQTRGLVQFKGVGAEVISLSEPEYLTVIQEALRMNFDRYMMPMEEARN